LLSYPLLLDEIRRYFETRERLGVLVLQVAELDRMESVYGWQACDRLLEQAAKALRAAVEQVLGAGILVAQDGVHQGRFVIFMPEAGNGETLSALRALATAEEVQGRLAAAFSGPEFEGMTPAPQFTAGAALLSDNPFFRFERLLRAAIDGAQAAGSGAAAVLGGDLEREIRELIRRGDMQVVYQPIFELEDRALVGYEAFVRGPAGSPLERPAMLFSYSDQIGLGRELDRACRQRALEAATDLDRGSLLFVNTLPAALDGDPAGDAGLSRLMARAGRAPEQVVLEVAERRLQSRVGEGRALAELRQLGVGLALDNAGSGYATLQLIEDLKPDFVKIDPTLVRGLDRNLVQQEVARSVVAVSRRVGACVVAPGIETEAEAQAARHCGVALAQGFHLARPRPPARPRARDEGSSRRATRL
jgi:EAL domain-containing protein (putative c-di-GMP-specific phosphodiesterase class I)/GGDEF domain-containing protein